MTSIRVCAVRNVFDLGFERLSNQRMYWECSYYVFHNDMGTFNSTLHCH